MSKPEYKMLKHCYFKQSNTNSSETDRYYSCCFSLGGNLDFPEFPKKSFTT